MSTQISPFEERQRKIIEEESEERKQVLRDLRDELERDYKDSHHWLDGDNQSNSPYEADMEESDGV